MKPRGKRSAIRLGHQIRTLRRRRELTLLALSEMSNTDKGNLSKIERGLLEPPLARLRLIARALGVSLSEIFRLAEEHGAPSPTSAAVVKSATIVPDPVSGKHKDAC